MKSPQPIHSLAAQLAGLGLLNAAAAVADRPDSAAVDTTGEHMARWLQHPQRVARVIRADVPPFIDGVLDDEAWLGAPVHTAFIQRDPDQGKPATERTEFRVVYDDEALYIAAICYDSRPDRITARLARRDEWRERDLFEVSLDPHHDHQTGAFFVVGPSGWMGDGISYNDGAHDWTRDGVWEARAKIRDDGWSVEMKIPYHDLRFAAKESYTWGFNVVYGQGGDNVRKWIGVLVEARPVSVVEIQVNPNYHTRKNHAQWIRNVDDDGDGEDDRFLFGELESRVFETVVRGTCAFTPRLSLQLYLSPFVTTGDYGAVKELARPRSYEFLPYAMEAATSSGGPCASTSSCAGSTGPAVPCSSCGSRTGTATLTTFAIPT